MDFGNRRVLFYGFATSNYFFREVIKNLLSQGHCKENLGVIYPNGQYVDFYKNILPSKNICYLYEFYNSIFKLACVDQYLSVVRQVFPHNCFAILAADKEGFSKLSSGQQILHLEVIFRIYNKFIDIFKPDYIVFPDIEVVDGFLLYNIAKSRGIPVAYTFHLRNLGQSVLGESIHEKFPAYFGLETKEGTEKAARFEDLCTQHLPKPDFFAPEWDISEPAPLTVNHALKRLLNSISLRLTVEQHYVGEDSFNQKIRIACLPVLERWRALKYRVFVKPQMHIRRVEDLPEKFYFYALQITPESSINYLSPLYIDQIRVIDEIRQALPSNTWLVAKEHPAIIGFRDNSFYQRLRKMPGVLLADALLPMEIFIEKCDVVFTVTGTVGLECLLRKKPCYMFGENFFSAYLPNKQKYPDVKEFTKLKFSELMSEKHDDFLADLPQIFSISHSFMLGDPSTNPYTLMKNNIENFALAIKKHFAMVMTAREG
jgi:hypothetical protein